LRYLWRFGYNRAAGAPNPRLQIALEGHEEDDGHTWYVINSSVHRSDVKVAVQEEKETGQSTGVENGVAKAAEDIEWIVKKRLCDLREQLHDRVKELMGPAYSAYFDGTHFARHGGLPGTTTRLRAWLVTLAECANSGALNAEIQAYVLRFLDAPVPEESDAALLQALGRCTVCTLLVEVPGRDVCVRCQVLRSDAVGPLQDGAEDNIDDCSKSSLDGTEDKPREDADSPIRSQLV